MQTKLTQTIELVDTYKALSELDQTICQALSYASDKHLCEKNNKFPMNTLVVWDHMTFLVVSLNMCENFQVNITACMCMGSLLVQESHALHGQYYRGVNYR